MKYQNLAAFEKHLKQAAQVQLARVFLIVSPCSYERKKIAEKILAAIQLKEGAVDCHKQDGSVDEVKEWLDSLNTTSLLSARQALFLDGIDKLKKNGLAPLADYAAKPSPFSYLLLGASAGKALAELYTKGKKELVACDLSDEKPWDRKDRLKRMLVEYAAQGGKRIHGDALDELIEAVGLSLPGLEQEVDKLIAYAGSRSDLTAADVCALCAAHTSPTLWQLADAIAWKETPPIVEESVDLGLLLPLLSQLRTQFQHGLAASLLLERGTSPAQIAPYIPSIKPAALDKVLSGARARKSAFFKRALNVIFDVELLAKNSAFEPALLLDLLLSKLTLLKRR